MGRMLCVAMLLGFVAVMVCEQKSAEPMPNKVRFADVSRDAGQAVDMAPSFPSRPTTAARADSRRADLPVQHPISAG